MVEAGGMFRNVALNNEWPGNVISPGKGVQQGGDWWVGCLPVLKKLLEGRSGLKRGSWIRPHSQSETFIHLNQFISLDLMEIPGIVLFIG